MFYKLVVATVVVFSSGAYAGTTARYKIPAGAYLEQEVFLRAPKININEKSDGTIQLEYRLPKELDGASSRTIILKSVSSSDPLQLTGDEAVAECEAVSESFSCSIFYKQYQNGVFPLDTVAADQYMAERQFSPARRALMGKAQMSIMHEAGGVLLIKKR